MTKHEILDRFKDINEAYNDSSRYDSLSRMLDELLKEQEHKDKMFHALEDDWKRLKELLKEQEAVVRCKDCKYFQMNEWDDFHKRIWPNDGDRWYECLHPDDDGEHGTRTRGPNWFCADGERRCEE